MEYITFKQFIYTINIRNCYSTVEDSCVEDNKIIRIYHTKDGEYKKDNYIDIGWYDYFCKDQVWEILKNTLNKDILESKVTDFYYNDKFNCLEVRLQNIIYEDLQHYQN